MQSWRRWAALLPALAFLLQPHAGFGDRARAQDDSPFAYLEICTPRGLLRLQPDGQPLAPGRPAPAGDPGGACHVCCPQSCCGALAQRQGYELPLPGDVPRLAILREQPGRAKRPAEDRRSRAPPALA